jgi:hypothetical protein
MESGGELGADLIDEGRGFGDGSKVAHESGASGF